MTTDAKDRAATTAIARARARKLAMAARRMLANTTKLRAGYYAIPPGYLRALETALHDHDEATHKEDTIR